MVGLSLGAIYIFWIAHCIISVFEKTFDTFVICICLDLKINDPPIMSGSIFQLVEDIKSHPDNSEDENVVENQELATISAEIPAVVEPLMKENISEVS